MSLPEEPQPENDLNRKYWEHTADEEFVLPYCSHCGEFFFPPRPHCPQCMKKDVAYRPASGRGTLTAYTTVHRPPTSRLQDLAPYVNALVRLEEGPQIMTNILETDEEELEIGMDVELVFQDTDGRYKLPCFQPNNKKG